MTVNATGQSGTGPAPGVDELGARLDASVRSGYAFVDAHPEQWDLSYNVDMETTNHVVRCRIQDGTIADHAGHVHSLVDVQHDDGGWADNRDDAESQVRLTSFTTQMLIRANRVLENDRVAASVRRGLDYVLPRQEEDGSWLDPKWHVIDSTSVSVGTLLFAVNEPKAGAAERKALDRGISYVVSIRQDDGLWYFERGSDDPYEASAHLLPKCATYDASLPFLADSARALMARQHDDGYWGDQDVDNTCDVSRALMLTASTVGDEKLIGQVREATLKAAPWLLEVTADGGSPDAPGKEPHTLRTCDRIDAFLKMRKFWADPAKMVQFWH